MSERAPTPHPRLANPLPCWHESAVAARTDLVVELSVHGGFIEGTRPLPAGTLVFLELSLGAELGAPKAEIDAVAEGQDRSSGFRVRFLNLEASARDWITAHLGSQAPPQRPVDAAAHAASLTLLVDGSQRPRDVSEISAVSSASREAFHEAEPWLPPVASTQSAPHATAAYSEEVFDARIAAPPSTPARVDVPQTAAPHALLHDVASEELDAAASNVDALYRSLELGEFPAASPQVDGESRTLKVTAAPTWLSAAAHDAAARAFESAVDAAAGPRASVEAPTPPVAASNPFMALPRTGTLGLGKQRLMTPAPVLPYAPTPVFGSSVDVDTVTWGRGDNSPTMRDERDQALAAAHAAVHVSTSVTTNMRLPSSSTLDVEPHLSAGSLLAAEVSPAHLAPDAQGMPDAPDAHDAEVLAVANEIDALFGGGPQSSAPPSLAFDAPDDVSLTPRLAVREAARPLARGVSFMFDPATPPTEPSSTLLSSSGSPANEAHRHAHTIELRRAEQHPHTDREPQLSTELQGGFSAREVTDPGLDIDSSFTLEQSDAAITVDMQDTVGIESVDLSQFDDVLGRPHPMTSPSTSPPPLPPASEEQADAFSRETPTVEVMALIPPPLPHASPRPPPATSRAPQRQVDAVHRPAALPPSAPKIDDGPRVARTAPPPLAGKRPNPTLPYFVLNNSETAKLHAVPNTRAPPLPTRAQPLQPLLLSPHDIGLHAVQALGASPDAHDGHRLSRLNAALDRSSGRVEESPGLLAELDDAFVEEVSVEFPAVGTADGPAHALGTASPAVPRREKTDPFLPAYRPSLSSEPSAPSPRADAIERTKPWGASPAPAHAVASLLPTPAQLWTPAPVAAPATDDGNFSLEDLDFSVADAPLRSAHHEPAQWQVPPASSQPPVATDVAFDDDDDDLPVVLGSTSVAASPQPADAWLVFDEPIRKL